MKANSAGNIVTNEYLNKINPNKLFVINRTKNADDKTLPSALNNKVIKDMKAIKITKYINLKLTLGILVKVVLKQLFIN